jgi:tRNA(fMet)-specific endonuclease VapC
MFCLDTNIVIAALTERSARVVERLDSELGRGTRILVPAIVLYELRFGIAKSAKPAAKVRVLEEFLSASIETPAFDDGDASDAADIRLFLHRQGRPIGPYDILIAAQARRRGACVVTANTREFARVPRLDVQDWTAKSASRP